MKYFYNMKYILKDGKSEKLIKQILVYVEFKRREIINIEKFSLVLGVDVEFTDTWKEVVVS